MSSITSSFSTSPKACIGIELGVLVGLSSWRPVSGIASAGMLRGELRAQRGGEDVVWRKLMYEASNVEDGDMRSPVEVRSRRKTCTCTALCTQPDYGVLRDNGRSRMQLGYMIRLIATLASKLQRRMGRGRNTLVTKSQVK